MESAAAIVHMRDITVRFGSVVANDAVSFDLRAGEVHALLGENGAGKTTLMRVLAGLIRPVSGTLAIGSRPMRLRSVADATAAGIGMVHQHFMLVPSMTVAENACLGRPAGHRMLVDVRRAARDLAELSHRYGLAVDPTAKVGQLSVGQQQRVEILKAVYRGARVLILDEPTAVLTPQEADSLLDVLRSMVAQGTSMVLISHKLREVMATADRVTVMRRGRTVGTYRTADVSAPELASLMVGREVPVSTGPVRPRTGGDTVLELRGARVTDRRGVPRLDDVTLRLRAGEILGIAGVDGNGQRELAMVIAGTEPLTGGSIHLRGRDVSHASPATRIAHGLAHVPEDRQGTGLVLDLSITDNAVLEVAAHPPHSRRGWLNRAAMRAATQELIDRYDIRCSGPDQKVRELSGGNQQKLLLAREIAREPAALLVSQPTRGLDIGAIEYVHGQLRGLRERGCGILLISTELDEILALADRVAVLYGGRITALTDRADVRVEELGLRMAGR
ncbi:ABC transporter ATP-binding protein [Micromonospora sp. CPCC 205371]|nr:ABC transporter ATP-binding protein [Micromonospora sp. CPCC 205371]